MSDAAAIKPPHRLGWAVRVGVYAMLVASAFAAFFLDAPLWEAARQGNVPEWAPLLPAVTFTAFVIIYAIDRLLLVQRRNYPLARALFQVAAGVVFLTFLLSHQAAALRANRAALPSGGMTRLLAHRDAEVRAAACELAGYRRDVTVAPRLDELARRDADPMVRATCAEAIARLNTPVP
jgi:hypothetical protein